jgi:hypothetical protein
MKIATRFSRFAWKELLRGPLGTPIVLARGLKDCLLCSPGVLHEANCEWPRESDGFSMNR